jgi:deoxyadenosine/deoxycytidine kinase
MVPWVLLVEGNIGAGKSSMIKYVQQQLSGTAETIAEPINQTLFMMMSTSSITQQRLWANFCFQMCTLMQRAYNFKYALGDERCTHHLLLDRSMYGDMLFAAVNADNLKWAPDFIAAYDESCKLAGVSPERPLVEHVNKTTLMIYVATDVQQCKRQIATRARTGEDALTTAYLGALDDAHMNMILYIRHVTLMDVAVVTASCAWNRHEFTRSMVQRMDAGEPHGVPQFQVHFGTPTCGLAASTLTVDWHGAAYPSLTNMLAPIDARTRSELAAAMIAHNNICLVNGCHL